MSHPDLYATLVCTLLGWIAAGVKLGCDNLDRIIQALERRDR
jgi:hypothetical protein